MWDDSQEKKIKKVCSVYTVMIWLHSANSTLGLDDDGVLGRRFENSGPWTSREEPEKLIWVFGVLQLAISVFSLQNFMRMLRGVFPGFLNLRYKFIHSGVSKLGRG